MELTGPNFVRPCHVQLRVNLGSPIMGSATPSEWSQARGSSQRSRSPKTKTNSTTVDIHVSKNTPCFRFSRVNFCFGRAHSVLVNVCLLTDSRGRAAVHKANWVEWYHTANAAQEIRPLKTRNWKMNSYFEGFLASHFLFWGERMQQRKRRNVKILDFKQSAIRKARFLACPKTKTQHWPSTDVVEKCGPAITQHLCTYSDSIGVVLIEENEDIIPLSYISGSICAILFDALFAWLPR